jgi:hypothetical protein
MKSITPDVLVCNEGTVVVFCPLTSRAEQWIQENVLTDSWQWFGNALVVEQRHALSLGQGMKLAGLRLAYGNVPVEDTQPKPERTTYDQAIDRASEAQVGAARCGGKKRTREEVERFILKVLMLIEIDEPKGSGHEN